MDQHNQYKMSNICRGKMPKGKMPKWQTILCGLRYFMSLFFYLDATQVNLIDIAILHQVVVPERILYVRQDIGTWAKVALLSCRHWLQLFKQARKESAMSTNCSTLSIASRKERELGSGQVRSVLRALVTFQNVLHRVHCTVECRLIGPRH